MKKKIIYSCIVVVALIVGIIIGKFSSKKDVTELKYELKTAMDKMADIEKQNEKFSALVEEQEKIINSLKDENETSAKHIQSIKETNHSTKEKLEQLESSKESIHDSLNQLRENNKILLEHYQSTTSIMEE